MSSLSVRLSAIADFIAKGSRVCDVGTDHALLAIHLIKSGIAKQVIATDIGKKPLKNALKNIENANVCGIDLRLCDGLSGISENEADTVVIAGMGGEVISGIIKRGADIAKNVTLILQPTTSPEFLRLFLYNEGYRILEEVPI